MNLLQFDVCMELGRYSDARNALNKVRNKNAFDYLVRLSKWEDHNGNLDKAIDLMEIAFEKIKEKDPGLFYWTLSSLADMYGHAGNIRDSYDAYLEVLKKDPANLYCLKGIAWIAFAHDGNHGIAKRIIRFILSQTRMPELKLLLADIAADENKIGEKNKWLNEFIDEVSLPAYGGMYNKYLIGIYNEDLQQFEKAITIAEQELKNRNTPETADWLAWSYYKSGDRKKAFKIAHDNVFTKTFEPEALMHTAFIFSDHGKKEEAGKLLKECLASSFELGPANTEKIKRKLKSL